MIHGKIHGESMVKPLLALTGILPKPGMTKDLELIRMATDDSPCVDVSKMHSNILYIIYSIVYILYIVYIYICIVLCIYIYVYNYMFIYAYMKCACI